MANKAIKKEVYRDKYFTAIVYEYRGCEYEVEYANQICCTPAWIQHRDKQAEIDEKLDNPAPVYKEIEPFEKQLDDIWNMMGWD